MTHFFSIEKASDCKWVCMWNFYLSACTDKEWSWSSSWLSRKHTWNVSVL